MTNVVAHPSAEAAERRAAVEAELGELDRWDRVRLIWLLEAREKQLEPPDHDWLLWLLLSGRGFGKTRVGAEDLIDFCTTHPGARYAIVAPTFGVGRDVCVEGESGVLAHAPSELEDGWNRSEGLLRFPNGSQAKIFSAEKPDRLRGPQHHRAWFEELASFPRLRATWDMAMFGLRLPNFGTPRAVITTTPRPLKLLRDLVRRPHTRVTTGSSFENAANLSAVTLDELRRRYASSRLGLQELEGVILDDVVGALWNGDLIAQYRLTEEDVLDGYLGEGETAVAVDPTVAKAGTEGMDETGIVAGCRVVRCPCGRASRREPHVLVLGDHSVRDGPVGWGRAVVRAAKAHDTRTIVGETNNGGDLVRLNVVAAWHSLEGETSPRTPRYAPVTASRGKKMRAEPVSTLYEQGRVHHVGSLVELEHQMCTWVPPSKDDEESYEAGETDELGEDAFTGSPDRVDALVWLVTYLLLDPKRPRRGGLVFVDD